ncbi:sigma-70 family RNA polymerase sigma factor [Actinoplanes sp. TRM 88003]|uniref:Sigma-70 family RNA polymerase sigma factor n=1 Tax=Paractinoplanes aksuensis TaxID=2939490 RepID=A0ABT1DIW3_9ACTN|nr:sigma-70 family RNA polymerase sigma factor [Actinoplanes aksuensis]MCO8270774.1 sigma-70 family RNA polymerase sigma factor [Actinoplanes aksuensis]
METSGSARADVELLDAIAERDRGALRELYERHAPWLRARLGRRCGDEGLVEEVLQDTFVEIWRKPGNYRGAGPVPAWVWGIGVRRLLSALRPRWPVPVPFLADPAPASSAEDQVLLRIEHGDLGGAVDGLSPELRAVIQAVVLDGLNSREAARLLRVPAATVRSRLMRARTQLREALL